MDINNKSRIRWSCRRGIHELDITIMSFFEYEYNSLTENEKYLFICLLEHEDFNILNWLINNGRPDDDGLYHIIQLIQNKNK
ncbi:MAG: succinate dehydrogenase assembly factor 2 [Arsenophonus sp. ET-YP4-MAG3]